MLVSSHCSLPVSAPSPHVNVQALGVPVPTVYSRLRLGRERFAKAATRRRGKDVAS